MSLMGRFTLVELEEGDRVRAVRFWLDEGLRIWPVDLEQDLWRVVLVEDQEVRQELMRGSSRQCRLAHPDARYGINDNESVPPGTEGRVDVADAANVMVVWDNGRRLGVTDRDVIEKV